MPTSIAENIALEVAAEIQAQLPAIEEEAGRAAQQDQNDIAEVFIIRGRLMGLVYEGIRKAVLVSSQQVLGRQRKTDLSIMKDLEVRKCADQVLHNMLSKPGFAVCIECDGWGQIHEVGWCERCDGTGLTEQRTA